MKTSKKSIVEIDEPELTGPEIAVRLRIDPATVRQFRREGMPGRRTGYRKFLYRLSQVNAWLEERETKKEKIRQQRATEREKTKAMAIRAGK
jgi:hypothetical protein